MGANLHHKRLEGVCVLFKPPLAVKPAGEYVRKPNRIKALDADKGAALGRHDDVQSRRVGIHLQLREVRFVIFGLDDEEAAHEVSRLSCGKGNSSALHHTPQKKMPRCRRQNRAQRLRIRRAFVFAGKWLRRPMQPFSGRGSCVRPVE